MTKQPGKTLSLVLGLLCGFAVVILSTIPYIGISGASSSQNVVASASVGYLCDISVSNTAIGFGNVNPTSGAATSNLIVDTNTNGNLNGNIIVSGTGWVGTGSNTMVVGQTLWDAASSGVGVGTALTTSNTDTKITVPLGASNNIYFGLNTVPLAAGSGIYTQTLTFYNSCPGPLTNSIVKTITLTANIQASCGTVLNTQSITFTALAPGASDPTSNQITDTNTGSAAISVVVYGSSWVYGANSFGVSNTLWNPTSLGTYGGNALAASPGTITDITIPGNTGTASSNSIYFGLGIPAGTVSGTYTQNIAVENSC